MLCYVSNVYFYFIIRRITIVSFQFSYMNLAILSYKWAIDIEFSRQYQIIFLKNGN